METKKIRIRHNDQKIEASIHLKGSKSISNRILIMRALSGGQYQLENLSESADTHTLIKLLNQEDAHYDAGLAGTTFRFMTAYLALKEGTQTLTGSERMLKRPIGPLVDALNELGCQIEYLSKSGYPPLKINSPNQETGGKVNVRGDISSQFLSALLMIAPYTSKGIEINILEELVSRPYLEMTINLIKFFGADILDDGNRLVVKPGNYEHKGFYVEGDWSSASYIYEMASFVPEVKIEITGLLAESLQGDSRIAHYAKSFGLKTDYHEKSVSISRLEDFKAKDILEFDLIEEPDLCQTLACMCAGHGYSAIFTGLKTLRIKETDRIEALRIELEKLGVFFNQLPKKFSKQSDKVYFMLQGTLIPKEEQVSISTYHDHRMAMAFAPLAVFQELEIKDPEVVVKSYPDFWNDFKLLGLAYGQ